MASGILEHPAPQPSLRSLWRRHGERGAPAAGSSQRALSLRSPQRPERGERRTPTEPSPAPHLCSVGGFFAENPNRGAARGGGGESRRVRRGRVPRWAIADGGGRWMGGPGGPRGGPAQPTAPRCGPTAIFGRRVRWRKRCALKRGAARSPLLSVPLSVLFFPPIFIAEGCQASVRRGFSKPGHHACDCCFFPAW